MTLQEPDQTRPPGRRRLVRWALGLTAAAAAMLFAVYEGPLFYELAFSAIDSFPEGLTEEGRLLPEVSRQFAGYGPRRIVPYLRAPRATLRATACMVLGGMASRKPDHVHYKWEGTAAALARMLAREPNSVVLVHGLRVLGLVPNWSDEDFAAALELVDQSRDRVAAEVVSILEKKWTGAARDLPPALTRWSNADGPSLRRAAVLAMARSFPAADGESERLLPTLFAAEGSDMDVVSAAHDLLLRRPDAGVLWLRGDDDSRRLALEAICYRSFGWTGAEMERMLPPAHPNHAMAPHLTAAATTTATEALTRKACRLRTEAVRFLAMSPAGRQRLAEVTAAGHGGLVEEILKTKPMLVPDSLFHEKPCPGFAPRVARVALLADASTSASARQLLRQLPPLSREDSKSIAELLEGVTPGKAKQLLQVILANRRNCCEPIAALARRWVDSPNEQWQEAAMMVLASEPSGDDDVACRLAIQFLTKPNRFDPGLNGSLRLLMQRRPEAFLELLDSDVLTQRRVLALDPVGFPASTKSQLALLQKLCDRAPEWLQRDDAFFQNRAVGIYKRAGMLGRLLQHAAERAAAGGSPLDRPPAVGTASQSRPVDGASIEAEMKRIRDVFPRTSGEARKHLARFLLLLATPEGSEFVRQTVIPDMFDRDDEWVIRNRGVVVQQLSGRNRGNLSDACAASLAGWVRRRFREVDAVRPKLSLELRSYVGVLGLSLGSREVALLREEFPDLMKMAQSTTDLLELLSGAESPR